MVRLISSSGSTHAKDARGGVTELSVIQPSCCNLRALRCFGLKGIQGQPVYHWVCTVLHKWVTDL